MYCPSDALNRRLKVGLTKCEPDHEVERHKARVSDLLVQFGASSLEGVQSTPHWVYLLPAAHIEWFSFQGAACFIRELANCRR